MSTRFILNGKAVTVDVDPTKPLRWTLRDEIGMTDTKFGCGVAACGGAERQTLEEAAVRRVLKRGLRHVQGRTLGSPPSFDRRSDAF